MSTWKPSALETGTSPMTPQISVHVVFAKYGSPQMSSTAARPRPMTICTRVPHARAHRVPLEDVRPHGSRPAGSAGSRNHSLPNTRS